MPAENRRQIRKSTLAEQGQEKDLAQATIEERMAMVWPLTVSAWAMMGVDLRGSRLQRHVERVVKRSDDPNDAL